MHRKMWKRYISQPYESFTICYRDGIHIQDVSRSEEGISMKQTANSLKSSVVIPPKVEIID
jgi:hypothetical protein